MSAAHTPGPWFYRPLEHDDWGYVRAAPNEAGEQWPVAIARGGKSTHREHDEHRRNGTDPYEANARLIAAAPDLFEALGNCLALVRLKYGNLDEGANAVQQQAEAALAKARGEQ